MCPTISSATRSHMHHNVRHYETHSHTEISQISPPGKYVLAYYLSVYKNDAVHKNYSKSTLGWKRRHPGRDLTTAKRVPTTDGRRWNALVNKAHVNSMKAVQSTALYRSEVSYTSGPRAHYKRTIADLRRPPTTRPGLAAVLRVAYRSVGPYAKH